MKKITIMAALAAVALTGCTERVAQSTANAFGTSALVSEITTNDIEAPTMRFVYSADTLVSIQLSDEYNYWQPTTFTYAPCRMGGATYDVHMRCSSGALGSEMLPTDFYFAIGDNGFAKSALQVERHADGQVTQSQWSFAYTPEGGLTAYTYTSDQYRVEGNMQWTDGDLTLAERRMSVGASTIYDKVSIYYISSQEANPISNLGHVNVYDGNYGISFNSIIDGAYYAGLLGRAPRHLPLMSVRGEGSDATRTNYRWHFNQDGYPVSMTATSPGGTTDRVTEYGWRGFARVLSAERQAADAAIDSIYAVVFADSVKTGLMTPGFAQAIASADAAAAKRGEQWLDFDPWVGGKNSDCPSIKSVDILSCTGDTALARVELRPLQCGEDINTVSLRIVRTAEGWRVDDILNYGTSLRSEAGSYLTEQ